MLLGLHCEYSLYNELLTEIDGDRNDLHVRGLKLSMSILSLYLYE